MAGFATDWRTDLAAWLAPFLAHRKHRARPRMAPLCLAGLIDVSERKSVRPIAERPGLPSHGRLHRFIADGAWDTAPLERALSWQAARMVGSTGAQLVVDDTAAPKKGDRPVGVAPQHALTPGKNANCRPGSRPPRRGARRRCRSACA